MSHKNPDEIDDEIVSHQEEIENIETRINLKDASVATEGEIHGLETEQQTHRDNIQDLKNWRDAPEGKENT